MFIIVCRMLVSFFVIVFFCGEVRRTMTTHAITLIGASEARIESRNSAQSFSSTNVWHSSMIDDSESCCSRRMAASKSNERRVR